MSFIGTVVVLQFACTLQVLRQSRKRKPSRYVSYSWNASSMQGSIEFSLFTVCHAVSTIVRNIHCGHQYQGNSSQEPRYSSLQDGQALLRQPIKSKGYSQLLSSTPKGQSCITLPCSLQPPSFKACYYPAISFVIDQSQPV